MDGSASMIDFDRIFHTGVLVPDIDAAVELSARSAAARWCSIREVDQPMWVPGRPPTTVPLRITFSAAGPHRIELIEGSPGSLWDGEAAPGVHHVGMWVDDLAAATGEMVNGGWELVGAHKPPESGYGFATYLRGAGLELVELVTTRLKPILESWWAEGHVDS
jgi:hypothetical protein